MCLFYWLSPKLSSALDILDAGVSPEFFLLNFVVGL